MAKKANNDFASTIEAIAYLTGTCKEAVENTIQKHAFNSDALLHWLNARTLVQRKGRIRDFLCTMLSDHQKESADYIKNQVDYIYLLEKDISVVLESAGFHVSELNDGGFEIETWTDGGVNMLHYFKDRKELVEMAKDFDIDSEVLPLWQNDMTYRAKFGTLSKALSDMRKYRTFLRKTVKQL